MDKETYRLRRKKLAEQVASGIILLLAGHHQARNYKGNPFPFRQDSSFLYFTGINQADLMCAIDCDSGEEFLAGYDPTMEDAIWSGPQKQLQDHAAAAGIGNTLSHSQLRDKIQGSQRKNRNIHYLPPYTSENVLKLSDLLGKIHPEIPEYTSEKLIRSVIELRSVKSPEEIQEIENVLNKLTGPLHKMAMKMAQPGIYEHEIVAEMYKMAKREDLDFAYQVICSVRGETLHNESHQNRLQDKQLLLVDAGVESRLHYASDITRTMPVGGKFTTLQKDIYQIVLSAQMRAIEEIKPGIRYYDVHRLAAEVMVEGLKQVGLMRGDTREAVDQGAHALFFPHGLGHMLGLDVHDMEDLGENFVGYSANIQRSKQFGTAYLRLARELEEGFVLTVEPGIYFIPQLIEQWKAEGRHKGFIHYPALAPYNDFGGIRIEDNILVTGTGNRVLGNPIPKLPQEVEQQYSEGIWSE